MGKRSLANGAVGALAITAVVGCGELFTLDPSASGSMSSGSGGGSGSTGTASTTSSSSGDPKICKPGDLTTCDQGNYCKQGQMPTCTPCADFTDLKFGPVTKLAVPLPDMMDKSPRFPRIGPNNELFFTFTSLSAGIDIGHASISGPLSSLQWGKGEREVSPINNPGEDGASLYLPKEHSKFLEGLTTNIMGTLQVTDADVVLYHSNAPGAMKITAFNPGQKNFASVNLQEGTFNSNIAVSYEAAKPRFWYISNAKGPIELVTALPGSAPALAPIKDKNGCDLHGNLSPWVTPDGKWLFFSAEQLQDKAGGCMPVGNPDPYRLFYTAVNPDTGQQSDAMAREVFPEDTQGHATPSLSRDLCMIFFTNKFETPNSELYAAIRE